MDPIERNHVQFAKALDYFVGNDEKKLSCEGEANTEAWEEDKFDTRKSAGQKAAINLFEKLQKEDKKIGYYGVLNEQTQSAQVIHQVLAFIQFVLK